MENDKAMGFKAIRLAELVKMSPKAVVDAIQERVGASKV